MWKDINNNPNAPEVLKCRQGILKDIHSNKYIENREDYIEAACRGKVVLDVGVVEHYIENSEKRDWLHGRIKRVAKKTVGVDILGPAVDILNQKGFDVRTLDITKDTVDEKFEVIILGDIIEHVGNPEALLRNCAKMLLEGGKVLLTTPNPWYINPIIKNIFGRDKFTDSADHVLWLEPSVMIELAERVDLRLKMVVGIEGRPNHSLLVKIIWRCIKIFTLFGINRMTFSKTILYELQRVE